MFQGVGEPVKCAGGTFQAEVGKSTCDPCPSGSYCKPDPTEYVYKPKYWQLKESTLGKMVVIIAPKIASRKYSPRIL